MKDLGGMVKGKEGIYRIDVKPQDPKSDGSVEVAPVVEVIVFNHETGEKLRTEVFINYDFPSTVALRAFVQATMDAAVNDFR